MNKIIRICVPFIFAFLFISILIWLAGSSSWAMAADIKGLKWQEGKELGKSPHGPQVSLVVNTLLDELNSDGDCSLREAITAANINAAVDACPAGDAVITDTITFDVAGVITVTSQLSVTAGGPLVIDGGGVITTSGGGTTRVWWIESSHVELSNMVVNNGVGGINNSGEVEITNCQYYHNQRGITNSGTMVIHTSTIDHNIAHLDWYGGGIKNSGTLTIFDSTITNNLAFYDFSGQGGGIYNDGQINIENSVISNNSPGGIHNNNRLTISNSVLTGNHSYYGGGIFNTGILTITNSTFFENIAHVGGGVYNWGFLLITNSSFYTNNAYDSGWGGGIFNGGDLSIVNVTLSGNSAGYGGGISGSSILTNTIVANSIAGGDCNGAIIDGGHNISSDDSCGFDPANGSMPNTDPLLGPLQDNGGPTLTHALLPGSPAIDAGDDAQCPPTDQRGVLRPQDGDGDGISICDIGSYELVGPWVSPTMVTITAPSEAPPGPVINFTATVEPISTTLPITYVWQASGHPPITETRGLTDTVGWAWELPGTYSITVTASNPAGSVIDTHLITISSPIGQTYLPLIIKASGGMLATAQPASLPGDGAVMWLVIGGIVGIRKKKR